MTPVPAGPDPSTAADDCGEFKTCVNIYIIFLFLSNAATQLILIMNKDINKLDFNTMLTDNVKIMPHFGHIKLYSLINSGLRFQCLYLISHMGCDVFLKDRC